LLMRILSSSEKKTIGYSFVCA